MVSFCMSFLDVENNTYMILLLTKAYFKKTILKKEIHRQKQPSALTFNTIKQTQQNARELMQQVPEC